MWSHIVYYDQNWSPYFHDQSLIIFAKIEPDNTIILIEPSHLEVNTQDSFLNNTQRLLVLIELFDAYPSRRDYPKDS